MIPDEAAEAAAGVIYGDSIEGVTPEFRAFTLDKVGAALEAAAPYMLAEALEDAAEWLKQPSQARGGLAYWWLREKAAAYRKGRMT